MAATTATARSSRIYSVESVAAASCCGPLPPTKLRCPSPFQKSISSIFCHKGAGLPSVLGQTIIPSRRMLSNGYIGRDNRSTRRRSTTLGSSDKLYERLDSCLVISPPVRKKPRAIIKFLGGAFIGAVPEVFYSYLLELLAAEGYLIISVPYNVTFDHAQAAREIYEKFHVCLDRILTSGLPKVNLTASEFVELPLYSIGHSNGALLQALTGSVFPEKIPKANAIISYNNRPASEAVPYFEQFGPLVRQVMPFFEASPMYSMARSTSEDAWKAMLDMASMVPNYDQDANESLTKFVGQLSSVLNQVKFSFDTIDETDLLEETLKPRVESIGGTLEKILLTGTHVTPCTQEPRWEVGEVYTPADAIAQSLKSLPLNDIRALSRTITNWFTGLED